MDLTIKTQAMIAIEQALATIPETKLVKRIPASGMDLDTAPLPAIFFYDDTEKRGKRGRLATGIINLVVFAYVPLSMTGYDDANALADLIQGRIYSVMMTNLLTGSPLISQCEEGTVHKDYPNDEFLVIIMNYDVTYMHNFGNAFSNTDY